MPRDPFDTHIETLESPPSRLAQITPSDTADLPFPTRAVAVETSGRLQVIMLSGDTGWVHVAAGVPFPLRVSRILATGTTAAGIVALA